MIVLLFVSKTRKGRKTVKVGRARHNWWRRATKKRDQFISCTLNRFNSEPWKVLIFFKQHVLRIFLLDYQNILCNLLIHVREREKKQLSLLQTIISCYISLERGEGKRDEKIAIDDVVQLKDSSCRAGRPVSEILPEIINFLRHLIC